MSAAADTAEPAATAEAAPARRVTSKACDNCRIRKVRCDKNSPCTNCKRNKLQCTTSPRAARAKRQQSSVPSKYEERIERIDRRLDHMGRAISTLVAGEGPCQRPNTLASPASSDLSGHSIHPSRSLNAPPAPDATGPAPATLSVRSESQRGFQTPDTPAAAISEHETENEPVVEGPSSLSAHSTQAIDFLHRITDADRQNGHNFETRELLDALHQIVDTVKSLRLSPESLFTLAHPSTSGGRGDCGMPSIQLAAAVIQKAQDQNNIVLLFVGELLRSQSLSDLCLKVYFSPDYSHAEYIIINVVLYYLFNEVDLVSTKQQQPGVSYSECKLLCQRNVETALSGLPLNIKPTRDMVLALVLGESYAVPLPGYTPAMNYCSNAVKLASLAGKTFEMLYSAHALALPDNVRAERALGLSKELHSIQEQSRNDIQIWIQSDAEKYHHGLIDFISASDEVLWLSMLTLIHRAIPAREGSMTSFDEECISSARAALARHQSAVNLGGLESLSSYINWTILFSPFMPFIVLFCHVLETGYTEDLDRMQAFVNSIEAARNHSTTISKHHRLFQVFHDVALRYTELKTAATPSQDNQAETRTEMDTYLSALGFQPHVGPNMIADEQNMNYRSSMISPTMLSLQMQPDASEESEGIEAPPHLANWYSVSQQMMGLLDSDQLQF